MFRPRPADDGVIIGVISRHRAVIGWREASGDTVRMMTARPALATRIQCLLVALAACGGSGDGLGVDAGIDVSPGVDAMDCSGLEQRISDKLDLASQDTNIVGSPDYTLLLETEDGRTYTHSHGNATPTTVYESASTSKLVAAVVILDLVDQGVLTLDTKAHDLLPFWTETTVTLRHLLSFTSGFSDEPACVNIGAADYETCVETLYTNNAPTAPAAGTVYEYSGAHMQVAGLMAIKATGLASWGEVFAAWKARTGLFPTGTYDLPSATNPRLAGGMHWTATEYLGLLRALSKGQILQAATRADLFANQRGTATLTSSPAWARVKEDWSYGLGNWLECKTATTLNSFDCGAGHRNSSPGSYGSYPFLDFDHGYIGMLARMGDRGQGFEGILLFRSAEQDITSWADGACGN
jgi:CubicO group peptidase (beta-lactamase class C family)